MGRPVKYETAEQMQEVIDSYFERCEETQEPLTIEGLASALDMSRMSIVNYSKNEDFFYTIKKAREKINQNFAMRALKGDYNAAISIFLMKNNFGYVDKVESTVSTEQKVTYYAPEKNEEN